MLSFTRFKRLLNQLHWRLTTHARSGRDRPDGADIAVIIEVIDHAVADGSHFGHVKDLGLRQDIAGQQEFLFAKTLVRKQRFGKLGAQERVINTVRRSETVDMLVVGRQVGLVNPMHLFRQAHHPSAQFHLPASGVMDGSSRTGALYPVSGRGDLDARNHQNSRQKERSVILFTLHIAIPILTGFGGLQAL